MSNTKQSSNENKKPTTVSEITACAASMFKDAAVIFVEVEASFGKVQVRRDGSVWMF